MHTTCWPGGPAQRIIGGDVISGRRPGVTPILGSVRTGGVSVRSPRCWWRVVAARSLDLAVSELLPLFRVTLLLQLPLLWTMALRRGRASRMVNGGASIGDVDRAVMVCAAWLVGRQPVIATTGAVCPCVKPSVAVRCAERIGLARHSWLRTIGTRSA